MRVKILKYVFFSSVTIFISTLTLVITIIYGYFSDRQLLQLKDQASYLSAALAHSGYENFSKYIPTLSSSRITVISPDGEMICDSRSSDKEKVTLNNKEIKQAIKSRESGSVNYPESKTVAYAVKLPDGNILRISETGYSAFDLITTMLYPILVIISLVILFSVILASRLSKKITKPILELDIETPDDRDIYYELRPLVERINAQNRQISHQIEEIREQHSKQDSMRREFTANVSHELKTPLTSISGYAEIIKNGMVAGEDIQKFAGRIHEESQRLMSLVADILRLSQLEEAQTQPSIVPTNLKETSLRVSAMLEREADLKEVTFTVEGTDTIVNGSKQIIEEIIYNLCDNAIKYNNPGGTVAVEIAETAKTATISVTDSGIGIPKSELDRIFERFYRVNKSYSKDVGGTGLGLSIVKHGVAFHNGEISVTSSLGKGTKISVAFPK